MLLRRRRRELSPEHTQRRLRYAVVNARTAGFTEAEVRSLVNRTLAEYRLVRER